MLLPDEIMKKLNLDTLNTKQLKIINDYEQKIDLSIRDVIITMFANFIFIAISNYEILNLVVAIINMLFPIRFWYYISIGKKTLYKEIKLAGDHQ